MEEAKKVKLSSAPLTEFRLAEVLSEDTSHHFVVLHLKHKASDQDAVLLLSAQPLSQHLLTGTSPTPFSLLSEDTSQHFVVLHLKHKASDQDAVLLLSAQPLSQHLLTEGLLSEEVESEELLHNDVYANLLLRLPARLAPPYKGTLIHPATAKHLAKYRSQATEMVTESPEAFRDVTLPHLEAGNAFSLQWLKNFLDGTKEAERVVLSDADPKLGFKLAPDLKWDGKDAKMLYLTAVALDGSVRCLRDLRACHLPLLENIKTKTRAAVLEKYGVKGEELLMYVHYQPSYFHLHVHVVRLGADYPGMRVGKAHLLEDVVGLLRLDSEVFAKLPLTFSLPASDPLLSKLRAHPN